MDFPIPEYDAERVAALPAYGILDSAPEQAFDDITELAAQICQCPVASINLIDEARLWKKSSYCHPNKETQFPPLRQVTVNV